MDNLAIEDEVFASIYEEAQKQVSVEVPVYSGDGVTVIGEYEVNRM